MDEENTYQFTKGIIHLDTVISQKMIRCMPMTINKKNNNLWSISQFLQRQKDKKSCDASVLSEGITDQAILEFDWSIKLRA